MRADLKEVVARQNIVHAVKGEAVAVVSAHQTIDANARIPGVCDAGTQGGGHVANFLRQTRAKESPAITNGGKVQSLIEVGHP